MKITDTLLRHPWFLQAQSVMLYMALPGEPDLKPIMDEAFRTEKTVLLPRCEDKVHMTAREYNSDRALQKSSFGIWEPLPSAPMVDPAEIDLILVPGVAFDASGRRLGHGRGYYDRFMVGSSAKKIGICFSGRIFHSVPAEAWDIQIDALCTDTEPFFIYCHAKGGDIDAVLG